ncbi:AMP-binding protein [Streptomyces sp. ID05-47C]|nr:AMP-binding protein [Streptomyces sp. ID05-47C]
MLYTSGTTGKPKGVVRDCGGYAVALRWSMGAVYDVGPGRDHVHRLQRRLVVGHSYIVYGPLPAGATTVLYEGKPVGTPDAGQFWRVAADHRVKTPLTDPSRRDPRCLQILPSSEPAPFKRHWPVLPSFLHGGPNYGELTPAGGSR